jgi:shikimate kinase
MYIILIGMMGSGKTAIGRALAGMLFCPFWDLDVIVEEDMGCDITEAFTRYGEPYFRRKEELTMMRMAKENRHGVLALGGGSILSLGGMDALRSVGKCVYLRADVDVLVHRATRRIYLRPLLANASDPKEALGKLLKTREGLYTSYADVVLDVNDLSVHEAARNIYDQFGGWFHGQV